MDTVATETGFQKVNQTPQKVQLTFKHTHADSRIEFEPSESPLSVVLRYALFQGFTALLLSFGMSKSMIFGPRLLERFPRL